MNLRLAALIFFAVAVLSIVLMVIALNADIAPG